MIWNLLCDNKRIKCTISGVSFSKEVTIVDLIDKVREYKLCDFGEGAIIDEQYFSECVAILKTMIGRIDREIRNIYEV